MASQDHINVAIMPYYAGNAVMPKLLSNANYSSGIKDFSCIMSNGPLSAAHLEPARKVSSVIKEASPPHQPVLLQVCTL